MRTSPLPPQAEDVARRLNNLAALFDGDGVDLASRVGRVIDIWQARKTGGDCVCARARARARACAPRAFLPSFGRAVLLVRAARERAHRRSRIPRLRAPFSSALRHARWHARGNSAFFRGCNLDSCMHQTQCHGPMVRM